MKITDLNATCKSHTSNSQDIAKKTIQKIDAITSQLKQLLLDSAQQGESFDSVERKTRDIIFQIGKQSMDLFVSLQGNGDLGETTTTDKTIAYWAGTSEH
ncbi:MAG: hypothetical protein Q8M16_08790 [Pirellulaceae bacterium]|nr:hypothetical protein [Pirellulaceae bacterium]